MPFEGGEVIAAAQEERFTRKKHDYRLTLRFDPTIDSSRVKRKEKEWSIEKYEKMF
jgi:predicted NodU family carbamoyl transferase